MGQVVKTEDSMFLPLVDAQHGKAGGQNVHRKIQPVHIFYIHAQPGKDNILYGPFMGNDNQVFFFPIRMTVKAVHTAPEKFPPCLPARVVTVIQLF